MNCPLQKNSVKASPSDLGLSWSNKDIVKEAMNYTRTGNLLERYKAKKDLEKENKVFDIIYTVDTDTTKSFLENHAKELNQESVSTMALHVRMVNLKSSMARKVSK